MKVPTYPPLIRLDPNVGELKDEEQCRQGECYNEDERQREIATQEAATFGFEDAEAREVPMQSPGRHASRIVSGLHSDDHGGTPRGQRTARLSTRSHDCERPAGEGSGRPNVNPHNEIIFKSPALG